MYEVLIGEVSNTPLEPIRPGEPTPEVRSVYWTGTAADERAAHEVGYTEWAIKYGDAPVQALVKVAEIHPPVTT